MKKLTQKNYFTAENTNLTASKIKDYLLDPYYYHQKHVLRTIEEEPSDAMIIGKGLDTLIMYGKKKFNRLYKPVARRGKADGLKYTELTPLQYQKITEMANRIMSTTAYKELETFERQVILSMPEVAGGGTKGLAGMLDFLKVDKEKGLATIVDLKTTRSVDSRSYHFACLELGYWVQCCAYVKLVRHNFGIEKVSFFHLAIEKDDKGIYPVKVFQFNEKAINKNIIYLDETIKEISSRTSWNQEDVKFSDAEMLGEIEENKDGWVNV